MMLPGACCRIVTLFIVVAELLTTIEEFPFWVGLLGAMAGWLATLVDFSFFSFSSSWNLEMRFTKFVVSARPAYMVFGRSFLSLRCKARWVGPLFTPEFAVTAVDEEEVETEEELLGVLLGAVDVTTPPLDSSPFVLFK